MNIVKITDKNVMEAFVAVPKLTVTKIRLTNPSTMECPARILAKRRIIKAKGFVNIPMISMTGIKGIGTLSHQGTSGQNISLKYSLVPLKFTIKNVQAASTNVIAIFPVTFAPPGKMGTNPSKLLMKIKNFL